MTLNSITDMLPQGFSYIAGSSTGATTANPTVGGQTLTWNGPFTVPGGGTDYTSTPGETAAPRLALAGLALAGVAGLAYRREHRFT